MVDPELLEGLQQAVEKAPTNTALRLHFATLLLDNGEDERALALVCEMMLDQPDNEAALLIAASAAERLGLQTRAERYRRLASALEADILPDLASAADDDWCPNDAALILNEEVEASYLPPPGSGIGESELTFRSDESWTSIPAETNASLFRPVVPAIRLADVQGMAEVKDRIDLSFLGPLQNPDLRMVYGTSLRGGLILHGPPGCGKTFIGRALAGELGLNFISVEITDVLERFVGGSERRIAELFRVARHAAPCIVFIDELDALGHTRSNARAHVGRNVINQLIIELDGIDSDNEGVFVVGATNRLWDVDEALLRPGRFEDSLLIAPPDLDARRSILEYHLRDRPATDVDLDWLASTTEQYTSADLAQVCQRAAEITLRDAARGGELVPITSIQAAQALAETLPSTVAWFEDAQGHAMNAQPSGMYSALLEYLDNPHR